MLRMDLPHGPLRSELLDHYRSHRESAMPKKRPDVALALGPRPQGATLLRWLYDGIRTAIIEGRLASGARLPSTRSIARQYRLARGTVVAAFDHLIAEGYLEGAVGNGTFVRRMTPEPPAGPAARARARAMTPPSLSARGRRLAGHPFPFPSGGPAVSLFRLDFPALEAFPINIWGRIAAQCLRRAAPDLLRHGNTLGFEPLREAIAHHVGLTRGVRCDAGQVLITAGTQPSLDLIARLVLDPGDRVWMEDPGYSAAGALLRAAGAELVGVPVDAEGIDCEAGRRRCPTAKLVYLTPNCQFPLGCTLSLPRRLALLDWAGEAGAWVFEDDYDSQLGFEGRPLAALRSLDRAGCVVYSNSFSKMLFPSLRLGFLIVPPRLAEAARAARSVLQRFPSVLDQAVLAEFIAQGHMEQHMRRMRELYTERVEALMRRAARDLPDVLTLSAPAAGLQVVGWLARGIDAGEASRLALARGIYAIPLSSLTLERTLPPALVFGSASTDVRLIPRALDRLGAILRELKSARPAARGGPGFH